MFIDVLLDKYTEHLRFGLSLPKFSLPMIFNKTFLLFYEKSSRVYLCYPNTGPVKTKYRGENRIMNYRRDLSKS